MTDIEITDVWNKDCALTQKVLKSGKVIDLGINQEIFLVKEPNDLGESEHYYAQSPKTTLSEQRDTEGNVIGRFRQHSLEIVFHQADAPAPQGANTEKSLLQGSNGELGQLVKQKVSRIQSYDS